MIAYKNGQWRLCPYLIKYTQYEVQQEAYALDKNWWLDFASHWGHTVINEVIDVVATDEQLQRYNQIRDMPDDFGNVYAEYVQTGSLPDADTLPATHNFNLIINTHKEQTNSDYLIDLDYRVTCTELGI